MLSVRRVGLLETFLSNSTFGLLSKANMSCFLLVSVFNRSRRVPAVAVRPFPAAQPGLGQPGGDGVQQHLPGAVVGNAGPGRRLEVDG